uniref:Uncharacterized protein n=1 Tax=Branchiostoma floridae TaxID=7739 RepID=C3YCY0_BRAFL|eukprot:XP_002605921.1 hypothetical protein BRAFLDRAFT_87405 [Branchiostoma floridae]
MHVDGTPLPVPRPPQRSASIRHHDTSNRGQGESKTSSGAQGDARPANLPNLSPPSQESKMGTRPPRDERDFDDMHRVNLHYSTDTSTDSTGKDEKEGHRGAVTRTSCICLATTLALVLALVTAGFTLMVFMHLQQEQEISQLALIVDSLVF